MNTKQKEKLKTLIVATAFFILSFFLKNSLITTVLLIFAYLIAGGKVLRKAFINLSNKQFLDENFLMVVASIGAIAILEYREAAAVMIFYQIGELFESIATSRSRKSIKDLMDLNSDYAFVLRDEEYVKVLCEEVSIGDTIKISAGEKVPVDGKIQSGSGYFDTSAITGESLPVFKKEGDTILSGFINCDGGIIMTSEKEYIDSTVSKILELVETAASQKAKQENFITEFARWYTPVVVALAAIIGIIVPFFDNLNFTLWVHRALVFLVVSCPCALVISVPMSFFGGIGKAAKKGILIKGGNYIEALNKADTVCFDKTGTLTKGSFEVDKICPSGITEEELLKLSAYAQYYSNHPLSKAINVKYKNDIDQSKISDFTELPGMGISANVDGEKVYLGNDLLMESIGIKVAPLLSSGFHIATDNAYKGYITARDTIKENAVNIGKILKKSGIKKVIMLTGDNEQSAKIIKEKAGLDEFYHSLLPNEKVLQVQKLKDNGNKIIFAGDGINDAPVLMLSDCGIAMGALGSDAAIEAADVVIMDDNIEKLKDAIKISRKTVTIAKQNTVFAISVKVLVLLLSTIGLAGMWAAVFADVGVSIIAILNSFRTMKD